ncbi:hypothetical protein LSTR_LSTR014748 [Laodelphax striatellus]|uniref:Major facilitator superfamily (MFS) profile domain-containing protein n=1 Tax=Laodelphax striatellus TaxID=195883 RepID=A0A482XRR7_LAOST|nr:hypothetical protein LSTR_LSTR014748 [Laodelphax striatellus]
MFEGASSVQSLPTIFHIFAHNVPIEERSRAFGYLVAAGSVGQTVASIICPHLAWQTGFYLFGSLGIVWVLIWLVFYNDSTTLRKDEIPLFLPKVSDESERSLHRVMCHWPLWAVYVAHFAMNCPTT